MQYDNIYELLEAVRTYKLQGKERLRPCNSIKGTEVGYCTVDSEGPATRWVISVADLKRSCEARTSDEAYEVLRRMRSFQDRRLLLKDLRSGKLVLEERPQVGDPTSEAVTKESTEAWFKEAETNTTQTTLAVDPEFLEDRETTETAESGEVEDFLDMFER